MDGQCERVEGLIVGYTLDELEGSEKELVEKHVRSCARCSKALGEVEGIVSTLFDEEMVEPSAAVCDSVREAVRGKVFRARKPFSVVTAVLGSFVRRPVLAGASALAVTAAVTLLLVVPGLRSPEEVTARPTTRKAARKEPEIGEAHFAIIHDVKLARKLADYLSDSHEVLTLMEGPDVLEALRGQEWDRWVADTILLQKDERLEGQRPLLCDLDNLYREIISFNGELGEEEIRRIRQIISEGNLIERTKEALDSAR